MSTTPTINIVPGRIAGHSNVIINGYRYTNDRKRGNKTYMKCVLYSNGCRGRITLMDKELITPVPDHPTHDVQHSETYVHVSKQSLKRNAGHLIIDGTFKSAPQLFTFEKLQMIIQKFDSYPTILDFLKCTSCLM